MKNRLFSIVALLVVAMTSASCLLEKEGPQVQEQNVVIELSVSTQTMTKATPTEAEKVINSLRVYAFEGERLVGYTYKSGLSEDTPFYMDLKLPESGLCNIDFYAIANEAVMSYENGVVSLSENMTRTQLEAVKFTGLQNSASVPMYAQQAEQIDAAAVTDQANTAEGHQGHFVLANPVKLKLYRSLAKISLYAATATGTTQECQILSAELLAPGTRIYSYLFAQDSQTLNSVGSRLNNRSLLSSATVVSKSVTPKTAEAQNAENFDLIFADAYLPEVTYGSSDCAVSSGNSREVVMEIRYTFGGSGVISRGFVYMPPIERNTHYKVCLVINPEGKIIINYEVADWEDNQMDPISFDYPTHSYLREQIPTTQQEVAAKPSAPATMSETKPFVGYFQMTYPENDAWTPTLSGPLAQSCQIAVYEVVGSSETPVEMTTWPIEASENWYKIVVSPDPSKIYPEESVQLSITYQASGLEILEYMLINGSYQEYYWPSYKADSQQDANIVIITMVN